jgi:hypothetical protein
MWIGGNECAMRVGTTLNKPDACFSHLSTTTFDKAKNELIIQVESLQYFPAGNNYKDNDTGDF